MISITAEFAALHHNRMTARRLRITHLGGMGRVAIPLQNKMCIILFFMALLSAMVIDLVQKAGLVGRQRITLRFAGQSKVILAGAWLVGALAAPAIYLCAAGDIGKAGFSHDGLIAAPALVAGAALALKNQKVLQCGPSGAGRLA